MLLGRLLPTPLRVAEAQQPERTGRGPAGAAEGAMHSARCPARCCTAREPVPAVACLSAGVPMVPVSWQEMQCPQTKAVENRKVAKLDA